MGAAVKEKPLRHGPGGSGWTSFSGIPAWQSSGCRRGIDFVMLSLCRPVSVKNGSDFQVAAGAGTSYPRRQLAGVLVSFSFQS